MRTWIFAAAIAALGAPAQADPAAVQGVIDGQITAFRADDLDTAFTFAAPGIQGLFRNPSSFGAMVRQGYPMVWRPGSVEYLRSDQAGPFWEQEVLITDAGGRLHLLLSRLTETPDGWRIASVELLRAPEVGA